jgi:hypothetical protein
LLNLRRDLGSFCVFRVGTIAVRFSSTDHAARCKLHKSP